jgi:hypothetical protein
MQHHSINQTRGNATVHRTLIALAIAVLTAAPAIASEKTDVMAVVNHWADGFNKGDSKMELETCADETSIVDDLSPYEWHGAGACSQWKTDFDAFLKKHVITDMKASLMKPRHVDITVDHAYVVVPVSLTYKQSGKDAKDSGVFTLALQRAVTGWRITGWAWAAH